jgi:cytochrome b subunit of formate dehydrogenase
VTWSRVSAARVLAPACVSFGLLIGFAGVQLQAAASSASGKAKPAKADCTSCHDTGQKLAKSAHASLACDTCHENHETVPHKAGLPKPQCATCHADQAADYAGGVHGLARKSGNEGAPDCSLCHGSAHELLPPKSEAFRKAVPETCGGCHEKVVAEYQASVHGQALARGVSQAPLCTDCHGEHNIIRHTNADSPVNASRISNACSGCHNNVLLNRKFGMPSDRLVSFDSSFHGLAAKGGSQTVANCASCHGVHNILPSADPKSTVNTKNLARTCGKCHTGAGQRFGVSPVHVSTDGKEPLPLKWIRLIYVSIICVTIGLMLLHQGGDWVRKVIRMRFQKSAPKAATLAGAEPIVAAKAAPGTLRMLPFERTEHALLVVSFVILAWSGFALRYPDQWWAHPLLLMEGVRPMRSLIHRIAGAVFIALSVGHLISLMASRNLRDHWKKLLPTLKDPGEALSNFAYNLGWGHTRPRRSTHSYIEKAEYWAVLWGSIVMIGTGGMLWANNLVMRLLPRIWLDAATSIHFYEAVLATLAVLVWHFYAVIFDPEVYPLNTAFLTGRRVKGPEALEEPAPAEGD